MMIIITNDDYIFEFSEHQYSSAELIPETFSYTGTSGPLDLVYYFSYMAAAIIFVYVSLLYTLHFLPKFYFFSIFF